MLGAGYRWTLQINIGRPFRPLHSARPWFFPLQTAERASTACRCLALHQALPETAAGELSYFLRLPHLDQGLWYRSRRPSATQTDLQSSKNICLATWVSIHFTLRNWTNAITAGLQSSRLCYKKTSHCRRKVATAYRAKEKTVLGSDHAARRV